MNKLKNPIQFYDWGSKTKLTDLFKIPNPENKNIAEIWMGAHSLASSEIEINGEFISLNEKISQSKIEFLGKKIAERFNELPFLFKILCAENPLSIQVHPDKKSAEIGFLKENEKNIPKNAPNRNYKDANHKPELVFALTDFKAMNGFREFNEIAQFFSPFQMIDPAISNFVSSPNSANLKTLFTQILSLNSNKKDNALKMLRDFCINKSEEPFRTICELFEIYPGDLGVFSPFFLNVITLKPGESMFLYAKTPHAYLHGTALEAMANSDNVLRAGLTPKFIDIPELITNIDFTEKPQNLLKMQPKINKNCQVYPIPVDDFTFSVCTISENSMHVYCKNPTILLCFNGKMTLKQPEKTLELIAGESCFIKPNEELLINGNGKIAKISC